MVAPLFVMSLRWDSVAWRSGPFRGRRLTWRLGPVRRTIGGADLASSVLLLVMRAVSIWIALTGVPSSGGWQAQVAVTLQAAGQAVTQRLSILPNWLAGLLLALALLALGGWALAEVGLVRPRGPDALTPKGK
jgi:cytochrome c-type biogenesis protein